MSDLSSTVWFVLHFGCMLGVNGYRREAGLLRFGDKPPPHACPAPERVVLTQTDEVMSGRRTVVLARLPERRRNRNRQTLRNRRSYPPLAHFTELNCGIGIHGSTVSI